MRIGGDINCYHGLYTLEETVDIMAEAGFTAIDFSFMERGQYDASSMEPEMQQKFRDLRKYAEDRGLCFAQAHAINLEISEDPEETAESFRDVLRCMHNAAVLGAKIIVVHPLQHLDYTEEGNPEKLFEMNVEFYTRLIPYCKEYNIKVALENMCQGKYFPIGSKTRFVDSSCSTPEEFSRYLDAINSEWIVGCFDIGHCMLTHQRPEDFIRKIGGKRIQAIHVHDGDGDTDLHTLPYIGGMANWDHITKALKDVGFTGTFNFEVGNFLKPMPKELYPIGAKMIAETGKYLVSKIIG